MHHQNLFKVFLIDLMVHLCEQQKGMKEGFFTLERKKETRLDRPRPSPHCLGGDTGGDDPDVIQTGFRTCRDPERVPCHIGDGSMVDRSNFRDPEMLVFHRHGRTEHRKENPVTRGGVGPPRSLGQILDPGSHSLESINGPRNKRTSIRPWFWCST